jgi:hypothetical protein
LNAAADYAAAREALIKPLPAYVAYVSHTQASFGPFKHDDTRHIVVRTSDGKVVSGEPSSVQIRANSTYASDLMTHPIFEPDCYVATGARSAEFEGKTVEALSVRYTCHSNPGDHEKDFKTLYVDAVTHDPIAAVEQDSDSHMEAFLAQHYTRAGEHVVPSVLDVRVKGSGYLAWLDITVHQVYSGFSFSDHGPQPSAAASSTP